MPFIASFLLEEIPLTDGFPVVKFNNQIHFSVPPIIHRSIFVSVPAEPLRGDHVN